MAIKQMNFLSKEIAKLSSLFPNDATLQHLLEAHAYFPEFFPKGFLEMNLQSYSLKAQKMNQIELYFPPPEQGLEGEIFLGRIEPNQPLNFYLSFDDLTKNLIISGSPGLGKTNLMTLLMIQLLNSNVNFHVFDPKLDYRYLTKFFSNVFVTSIKDFKENILRPPRGVHPKDWLNYFVDFFCATQSGLIITKSILYELCNELYEKNSIYSGSENYPTFYDLLKHAEGKIYPKFKRRDSSLDSLISRLRMINYSIGDCLNVKKGYFRELLDKNFILEIAGANDDAQNLIIQWLSWYHFAHRIHNNLRNKSNQTIIFIDEAKRIADKSMDSTLESRVSPFSFLLTQTREYKLSFCIATQEYNRISSSLKSSSFTTIAFNSHNYADIKAVKESMGLTPEQTQILQLLPTGFCVVKKGSLRPIVMSSPYIGIKEL